MKKNTITQKASRWLPAIAYAILIFYLSSMSNPPVPETIFGIIISSFAKHYLEYFIFGLLLIYALEGSKNKTAAVLAIGIIYAASDEIHQYFVPQRTMDIIDFTLDSLGIITSLLTTEMAKKWQSTKKSKK